MSSEKQDVSSTFYTILGWLETNKKSLAVALVAVVVLSFVIVAYRWNAHQKELAANAALLKLRVGPASGAADSPSAPADFLKVADQFPGTKAAARAALLAANMFFSAGEYSEAQAQFQKFLTGNRGGPLAPSAALGVAASLEASGKTDEAISAYQNFQLSYPRSPFVDSAKLSVARLFESKNQNEQALKIYEELISASATSPAGSEAAQRKDRLVGMQSASTKPAVSATSDHAPAVSP